MNSPLRKSLSAWRISSCVFMTIGPCQAIGSRKRSAGDEKEADALVARLDDDLVARAEHDQRAVADFVAQKDLLAVDLCFAQHAERFGRVGEMAEPSKI